MSVLTVQLSVVCLVSVLNSREDNYLVSSLVQYFFVFFVLLFLFIIVFVR